ncbi:MULTISPECIES: hypothetical protein [Roseomonadaceae]|uniref:Uncharacterized protein n=1 Tax=Falsiroseomonas oleicola TaxID=2801474 RepID=A0ABS6HDY5_9PROT|nr:hypothetical protein [Roseomonas oleicola]MBU8546946.1 hypothetical protein [Roseomonas oleicola]
MPRLAILPILTALVALPGLASAQAYVIAPAPTVVVRKAPVVVVPRPVVVRPPVVVVPRPVVVRPPVVVRGPVVIRRW